MPIVIHGNPFGGPKADFDQAVAGAGQAWLRSPSIALNVHDGTDSLPEYYAVMAFNAPQSQSPWGLSATDGDGIPTAADGGQLTLLAAVCRGNDAIGWAIASAGEATGVQSPLFQTLVSLATAEMLQIQPSFRRHDDGANR